MESTLHATLTAVSVADLHEPHLCLDESGLERLKEKALEKEGRETSCSLLPCVIEDRSRAVAAWCILLTQGIMAILNMYADSFYHRHREGLGF